VNTRRTQISDRIRWLPLAVFRRRFPRLEIHGVFDIEDLTSRATVSLMDVSVGGFRSSSPVELRPGVVRTFRFPLGSSNVVTLSASAVHCCPVGGRTAAFIVGWAWSNVPINVEGLPIGALAILDYLTSDRSPVEVREESPEVGGDGAHRRIHEDAATRSRRLPSRSGLRRAAPPTDRVQGVWTV
jgi:hypothetical protein